MMAKAFSREEAKIIKDMKETMSYSEISLKTGASKTVVYRICKDEYYTD